MQTLGGAISTFFAPSLRRTLLLRALTIGLVPIVLIVALALSISQRLLQERFDDEARLVAGAPSRGIHQPGPQTTPRGPVLAALSRRPHLSAARDGPALRQLLLPLPLTVSLDSLIG